MKLVPVRAFLDDELLTVMRPTLASALAAAVALASTKGRIVVEASAGGVRIPDEKLESPGEDEVAEDIHFISVEPRALVRTTLLDAAEALDQARTSQLSCARMIQAGELDQSLEPLGKALETWRAVRDALERSVELLGLPGEGALAAVGGEQIAAMVQSLWTRLEEVRRSLAQQDWSALADALSYDMSDQVEQWKMTLRGLAEALQATDSAAAGPAPDSDVPIPQAPRIQGSGVRGQEAEPGLT